MYNVLLLEKDLDYGRKLINELSIYNNDLRFCSFIKSEREVSSEIYKNTDFN